MKINKSYLQLKTFDAVAADYLIKNGFAEMKEAAFQFTSKEPTKLVSAIKSIIRQLGSHFDFMNEEVDTFKIMNCATDPVTKVQLPKINGQRQYTVQGELKLKKDIKSFLDTEVEIHQRIVEDFGKLSQLQLETFSDIVIPKQNIED